MNTEKLICLKRKHVKLNMAINLVQYQSNEEEKKNTILAFEFKHSYELFNKIKTNILKKTLISI